MVARGLLCLFSMGLVAACCHGAERPNIVLILCDDLGYGDVRCNNPEGKIATPQIDRLASAGMRFTDAHSSSSVCTPTRYSILTGRYNWRSRVQSGVLLGLSPPLIEPGRLTVAELLRRNGYHTACIGKWHLGMEWVRKKPEATREGNRTAEGWEIDYTKPIAGGPNAVGFDRYFGISASLDMPPFVFLEDNRVTALPTVEKEWLRKGPAAESFEAVDVLPTLTRRAVQYIGERAGDAKAGTPFFLYLPLNAPHTPILPSPDWQGRSGLNPYADFVMQTDDSIGQVLRALEEHGLADDTLIVVTSDNGCSPMADLPALLAKGHDPSFPLRGCKSDIWDGGHRIPLVVRWPGKVAAGSRSDQLVGLVDLMATCADIVGAKLPDEAGEDSVSMLPVLLGTAGGSVRETLVHHSINGMFSIRQGRWKLNLCAGSGGWGASNDAAAIEQKLPPVQLYDMTQDIGERRNIEAEHPEVVRQLTALLDAYVANGRSTPGRPQQNDVPVDIWKRDGPLPTARGR